MQQHSVTPSLETVNTVAHVQQHSVTPSFELIESAAHVQQHSVTPSLETVNTVAHVQQHSVTPSFELIESAAHVQQHSVSPSFSTIDSVASVQQHVVHPSFETVTSSPIVQHHEVSVVNQCVRSVIEVPKFVFEFKEKEIPVSTLRDLPSLNNALVGAIDHLWELSKNRSDNSPSCNNIIDSNTSSLDKGSSVGTQTDTSSTVSGIEDFSDISEDAHHTNHNVSSSSSDDASGSGGGHQAPSSSDVDDSFASHWIVDELCKVNSKEQMVALIDRIQLADFDRSLINRMNDLDIPVILLMYFKDRWLGVGQFFCPFCDFVAQTSASLSYHWKSSHEDKDIPQEQAAMEFITGLKLRWKIDSPHLPNDSPSYRSIHLCPCSGCDYIVSRPNALSSHIGSNHQDLEFLKREVGVFWSMHILHARRTHRLLLAKDIFHDVKGCICKECMDFIGKDSMTVKQHSNRSHPHANIEGNVTQFVAVNISVRWLSPLTDSDELEAAKNDLAKEKVIRSDARARQELERSQPVLPRTDESVDLNAREDRRRRENHLREAREAGRFRSNETRPAARLHIDSSSSDDQDSIQPSDPVYDTDVNVEDLLRQAENWKSRCMKEDYDFVALPKLWGDRLAKHRKVVEDSFNTKITKIIKWYESALNLPNINKYSRLLLCDGLIAKVTLTLRSMMRKLFHIPHTRKEKVTRPRSLDVPIQLRSASKFAAGIELLHDKFANRHDLDQRELNIIADIKEKLSQFLNGAPPEFSQLLGGTDLDAIDGLINDEHFDERIRFIRSKLDELETKHCSGKSAGFKKFIQKLYSEDAKRTLDWFVLGDDSPECAIPVDQFVESYGSSWGDAATLGLDIDNSFALDMKITSDDMKLFEEALLNEEAILCAIRSRSNISAVGCDGLSNGLWKIGANATASIIKHIIKCMLDTGLFPEVLKMNKTVVLYKKGDVDDPHSWRPITITPTLYRILMCHISRSMQTLNSHRPFISPCQKGFMRIPAAASEHATTVDEMIHDASRNLKSLYITTIDFSDAFGSVPQELIKKNLMSLGFGKSFVKSIIDSYVGTKTRICCGGQKSDDVFLRKGVKQGCPLSPTLFNICIESLVKRLSLMKNDGYHWFGRSTSVQAYADDVIIFSDTEDGMCNLLRTIEEFCRFAGDMKINSKKCRCFSYVISNGLRCVPNLNFSINDGIIDNVSIQGNTTYLGLPIAARSSQRKKHIYRRIVELFKDVTRVTGSALRFTQAVDAIKRFILPKLDYELLSNTAPVTHLKRLDEHIRSKLSKMIGASGIPTDWFYTALIDGGIQLQQLSERQRALTIRLYVGMRESNDKCVRDIVKASDEAEINFRDAVVDENSPYLNLRTDDNGSLTARRNHGTSNLLARVVKSLHDLKVGLVRHDGVFKLKDLLTDETTDVSSLNVMKVLMSTIMKRHTDSLVRFPMKGHSFHSLRNSSISNFWLKSNSVMADSIVKFAVKARTNSLMTGFLKAKRNDPTNQNSLCKRCGNIETLHHILNGCPRNKASLIKRHDAVQGVLTKYLIDHKRMNVHQNQSIRGRGGERINGPNATLRPDLWWWENNRLMVAEFTIPYGMLTDMDGVSTSTLSVRRKEKICKYKQLIEDCKAEFSCDATLLVFVISSVGACPVETVNELKRITDNTKDALKLAARMVAASLRESMFVYMDWMKNSNKRVTNNATDVNEDSVYDSGSDSYDFHVPSSSSSSVNSLSDDEWNSLINDDPRSSDSDSNSNSQLSPTVPMSDADSESDVLINSGNSPLWSQGRVATTAVSSDGEIVQHSSSTS